MFFYATVFVSLELGVVEINKHVRHVFYFTFYVIKLSNSVPTEIVILFIFISIF